MKKNQVVAIIGAVILIIIAFWFIIYREFILLPNPPSITYELTYHRKGFFREIFKPCNWIGYKRKIVEACNYSDPLVRNYSANLAGHSPGKLNIGQICDIFDHYYRNWKYVNDPTSPEYVIKPPDEYVAKASETILNDFNGDCDDFAVLMCSSIIAIGGEARLNVANNDTSGHAFTEVNIGNSNIDIISKYINRRYLLFDIIWYREDEDGIFWLNLDWFGGNPGGKYFDYNKGTTYYLIQNYCEEF